MADSALINPARRLETLTILIFVHQQDQFDKKPYLLRKMMECWRAAGFQVVVQSGPGPQIDADLVISHIDLTVIPENYLAYLRRYSRVLNGKVVDISKRLISQNCLRYADPTMGPVMVKTNRNCNGLGEANKQSHFVRKLRQMLPWTMRAEGVGYRIFPSVHDVPFLVWLNRHLVVERFRPERHGELYALRTWIFFGDQETNSICYSHEPRVKATNALRREAVAEIPTELRRMREILGFDYGKFDYVIEQGQVVLYDVNRTPWVGHSHPDFLAQVPTLAQGLRFFLER
jgi:hypothetical protein